MSKVNEGLRIIADDRHALVINEQGMVNVETLVTGERPPSTMDFLCMASTLELIQAVLGKKGNPIPERLFDAQAAGADRGQTFHALRASGIAMRVLGDVGRRAALGAGQFGRGEVDYRPGFWLHPELVLPLARWIASRQVPPRKTPLIAFLEKHLPSATTGKAAAPIPAQEVTEAFANEVSAKAMEDLRIVDRMMITDGVSASERTEVLRARIDSMQGA
ncbi:hypothetical protein [Pseudomonas syringae group genomosp. 3]|uniref:Uncharacterized protein n=1 Tax=Pseudomonas syringae pv. primulae TaxID=251707 RepID=A0A3M5UAH9_9PSED|nr:hypothetical protein [Pseudomonas syringae group genomosp. 3]RMO71336.1 hypothetical protein ALQ36_04106 [Pseudomonas syringae pv. primulae]RMU42544.1 hypothetical protein ALP30_03075 [Pseudomonas syringae pv. primulae]